MLYLFNFNLSNLSNFYDLLDKLISVGIINLEILIFLVYLAFPQFWIIFAITFMVINKIIRIFKKNKSFSKVLPVIISIIVSFVLIGPCLYLSERISSDLIFSKTLEKQRYYDYFIDEGIDVDSVYDDVKRQYVLEYSRHEWDTVWQTDYLISKLNKQYYSQGIGFMCVRSDWFDEKRIMVQMYSLENRRIYIEMPIIITEDMVKQSKIIEE